jgi:hypothetical protein
MTTKEDPSTALADNVRDAFVEAAPGPGDVTEAASQACYGYLLGALESTEDPAAEAALAAGAVIEGAKKLISPFWHAARGALIGVLHAGLGQRQDLGPLIDGATRGAMDAADRAGGDFGAAAQGAVEGCVIAADELSLDPAELGSRAACAALLRAREMGDAAQRKIQHLVTRRAEGVTIRVPSDLLVD